VVGDFRRWRTEGWIFVAAGGTDMIYAFLLTLSDLDVTKNVDVNVNN
jgi:hypothetical protein